MFFYYLAFKYSKKETNYLSINKQKNNLVNLNLLLQSLLSFYKVISK